MCFRAEFPDPAPDLDFLLNLDPDLQPSFLKTKNWKNFRRKKQKIW